MFKNQMQGILGANLRACEFELIFMTEKGGK